MTEKVLGEESPAVQAHLNILQGVIQRMASNSSASKAWCITLVSAILVVAVDKGSFNLAWLAAIPTVLFLVLDAYYLALEKGFRASYNIFVQKVHGRTVAPMDLFAVEPSGSSGKVFWDALCSLSVWPVYVTLLGMVGSVSAIL